MAVYTSIGVGNISRKLSVDRGIKLIDLVSPNDNNDNVSVLNRTKIDEGNGIWDTEGCYEDGVSNDPDVVKCACNHFTNFALLISSEEQVTTPSFNFRVSFCLY